MWAQQHPNQLPSLMRCLAALLLLPHYQMERIVEASIECKPKPKLPGDDAFRAAMSVGAAALISDLHAAEILTCVSLIHK